MFLKDNNFKKFTTCITRKPREGEKNGFDYYFYDNLFDELLKENSYINLIIVLHYILARVKWSKYKDEDGNIIENKHGYLKESIYNNLRNINKECEELW